MIESSKIELDSSKIPFEICRNKPNIYKFKDIYYNGGFFHYYTKKDKRKRKNIPKSLLDNFKIDTKIIYPVEKCTIIENLYIFWPMSLNNIGHFLYDNVLPIYKMIILDQEKYNINNKGSLYFIRRSDENTKEQTLRKKGEELLKIFVKEIKFLNKVKGPIYIKNATFQKSNLRSRPWDKYSKEMQEKKENKEFLQNFVKRIKDKYNINEIKDREKIVILSRGLANWRRITNESKIIKGLKEVGYKTELIKFERLTLKEEIEVINKTKILIAPYGAGVMGASLFLC